MLYFFAHRELLIPLLPPGLSICEIGVQKGLFSRILNATKPRELHLVDPWECQNDLLYSLDAANVASDAQQQNFELVTSTFQMDPAVKIHRGYSTSVLPTLAPASLDVVYIDGNHTYEAVLSDLQGADRVLNDQGLIMGHDFCSNWRSQQANFGVVGAVTEFCKTTGYDLFGLTCSIGMTNHDFAFSTYFIAKRRDALLKTAFLKRIFDTKVGLVDLPLGLAGAYSHKVMVCSDGSRRYIPSFSSDPLPMAFAEHRGW